MLHREASLSELGRVWGIVYTSNLVGGGLFAWLIVFISPQLGTVNPENFGTLATSLVAYTPEVTLVSGVLAGWLMGLMTWLVAAGRQTISQVVFVWMIAFVIGISHLPHSIAGSVEVLLGVFSQQAIPAIQFLSFLLWSTVGNIIGGTVFVALLKYGHGIKGGQTPGSYSQDVELT